MKRNGTLRTGRLAAALVGAFVMTACGGDPGDATPDVAARLETQARDAAKVAQDAMEKAAEEGSQAASARVEAAADAADATGDAATELAEEAAAAVPGTGPADEKTCLERLEAGAYAEAVAACSEALGRDPTNEAVKEALATARSEAATAKAEAGAAGLTGMR